MDTLKNLKGYLQALRDVTTVGYFLWASAPRRGRCMVAIADHSPAGYVLLAEPGGSAERPACLAPGNAAHPLNGCAPRVDRRSDEEVSGVRHISCRDRTLHDTSCSGRRQRQPRRLRLGRRCHDAVRYGDVP